MQRDSLEPAGQPEPPSELLRIGKDEMNLAEFPLTLLSDRAAADQTSLKFEDRIYDDRKGKLITRKRVIEGSKEYGLPTATDDAVILALIQLTKLKNGFTAREVDFTRHELIQMLRWPDKGQSYERIALSLHRVAGVTYHFENSWWDNRRKTWTTRVFGIIDTVELNDGREAGGPGGLFPSRIIWNPIIFDSFQAGYLRSLDFHLAIGFKHAISLRMYRFLGKRFHLKPEWLFELTCFAYEHIGLSRVYEGGTQIVRKLRPAISELERVGFLEPLPEEERFTRKGRRWSIRLVRKAPAAPAPAVTDPAVEGGPPLVAALTARGVTGATATELMQRHPAGRIERKLEVFDWLTDRQDKRIARSPAGYLVASIEKDYAAPRGFVPKAEREGQEEARRRAEREAAEECRRRREREARDRAEQQAVAAYWAALTPGQQAELDAASRATTDPDVLAMEARDDPTLKRIGQQVRRQDYIRQLLGEGSPPADR